MCGRVACSLNPDGICTSLLNNLQNQIILKLKNPNEFNNFKQSYNIAPTQYCCALTNCGIEDNKSVYNVECMQWGLVPSWGSGGSSKITNARSDSLLTKKTFIDILKKGRRCVLLVEGYYEWKTNSDKSKIPYYFYLPHNSKMEFEKEDDKAHKILTIAALYDESKTNNISQDVAKMFSVITVDADSSVSFVHDRMPAILNGYEEINAWLNDAIMPYTKAVKELIRPANYLKMHRVSSLVNQSKSQGCELILPYSEAEKKQVKSNSLMMSWLKSSTKHTSTNIVNLVNKELKFNDKNLIDMKDCCPIKDLVDTNCTNRDKEEQNNNLISKDSCLIKGKVFNNSVEDEFLTENFIGYNDENMAKADVQFITPREHILGNDYHKATDKVQQLRNNSNNSDNESSTCLNLEESNLDDNKNIDLYEKNFLDENKLSKRRKLN